ncbi:MAG: bifunctional phosphoribosyl-AMP cyclohydrolase/phosphoribosyl-ATP pyrophosphatase [Acidobacteria bacterium]|nr:MAG: bifunctional phosphoribosyl-AMP cyclohydrolase/phosphoribosyl-ATP pyrophosphatase [Acidobacteriota bacterium]
MKVSLSEIKFDERGLAPTVVQDARTGEVLMLAYMNAESLQRTLAEGETWFWSRSRAELWHKGATSGHTQRVASVRADCDADALLVSVEPRGPACHTGARTCFHQELDAELGRAQAGEPNTYAETSEPRAPELGLQLRQLYALIERRRQERPEGSYTTYLFNQGLDKILKKLGEETAETIIAAKNGDAGALVAEASDLLYHLLVLCVERGVTLEEISAELVQRSGQPNERLRKTE